MASPIPLEDPVTMATLPSRSGCMGCSPPALYHSRARSCIISMGSDDVGRTRIRLARQHRLPSMTATTRAWTTRLLAIGAALLSSGAVQAAGLTPDLQRSIVAQY